MKSMILPAAVLLTSISLMAQNNGPEVLHFNGTFATAFAVIQGRSVSLNVSRGVDVSGQLNTFLFFDIVQSTDDGIIDTIGEGHILNTAFHGNDPVHMVLDVDLSQVTDFISSTCTFSFTTFTETCGPGITSGLIHLEWHPANLETTHSSTDMQQTFLQARINSHEVLDNALTTLTGSFLGQDVTDGSGGAGTQHDSTMTIELVK
jgi:hypothetical protein